MRDRALAAAQRDRRDIRDAHARRIGHFHGACEHDRRIGGEIGIDPHADRLMLADVIGDLVRGPPARRIRTPGALARRIIRQFVLVEKGAAVLAIPQRLPTLEMLDEQAIAGDVIPVDDEAVRRPAFVPADVDAAAVAIAVVGAPDPEMVADDMVAVDFQTGPGVPHGSPADAEEEIGEQCRIVTMIAVRAARPDLHQHRRRLRSGVDQQSGDRHPRHVGDGDGGRSAFGQKGRETEAEDDRIGPHHPQRFAQAIHAGRQQQMAPGRERAVDGRDRRGRIGDEHGVQRHMASGGRLIPGYAARITAERRDEDRPFAPRPDAQERLLAYHRHGRHRRIGWSREARRGRARNPHEHHVPVRSLPALHAAVAGEPLLLRTGADRPVHPAIRHEAAARPAAIVQGEVAGQMDAAIGRSL
ncbi:hypothetical protein WR25_18011 [Diploscapter pachys]|uniref:Uncharacterized protein n=1 Tax=Diploscapter pachys TaxID=2018661 RepID=A0A2A2K1A3_9BILA|nr:hypothetical protein WR25_18011 [Diploscapter pachys]